MAARARRPDPPPLPTRDVLTVAVGTAAWALALVLALILEPTLRRDGHLWWLATAAVGTGLGLLGMLYCARRQASSSRASSSSARPPP